MVIIRGKKNLPPNNPHHFTYPFVWSIGPHYPINKEWVVRRFLSLTIINKNLLGFRFYIKKFF